MCPITLFILLLFHTLIPYLHIVPSYPTLILYLCTIQPQLTLKLHALTPPFTPFPQISHLYPHTLCSTLYLSLILNPYPLLTSPRNSLSSSRTRAWSHSVISSIRSLNSRLCTGEYMNVWLHLGSRDFFTVFVLLLLLSLNRNSNKDIV